MRVFFIANRSGLSECNDYQTTGYQGKKKFLHNSFLLIGTKIHGETDFPKIMITLSYSELIPIQFFAKGTIG